MPEELRIKPAKEPGEKGYKEYLLYAIPLLFGLFVFTHIYLAAITLIKNKQLSALKNKWQALDAERKKSDNLNQEAKTSTQEAAFIQGLIERRITWAEKLNKLSLKLPAGVWFTELSVSGKDFILQGAVVSPEKRHMNLIKKLIDSLKNDTGFFKDFSSLELGSVQQKVIGSYDIVEFILLGAVKQ